jgi:hypothetical protein
LVEVLKLLLSGQLAFQFSSSYEFENFLSQVHFLEKLDISCSNDFKGVKGRLAKHIEFWMNIGASDFAVG